MRRTLLVAGLVAIAAAPATANDKCSDASDQATLNECADKAFKTADGELNRLYKEIRVRLKEDADTSKLLVAAQKDGIAYRDAECRFSTSASADGSIHPMMVSQCREGITQNRIRDFKRYLSCEEGDLSCPVPAAE